MTDQHKCFVCGATGVRLYRPGGMFLRASTTSCKKHQDPKWGSYLPMWIDDDGSVWGKTSAPQSALDKFNSLPEVE